MTDHETPDGFLAQVAAEPMPAALAFPLSDFGEAIVACGYSKGLTVTAAMVGIHNDLARNYSDAHDPLGNARAIVPEMLIVTLWERLLAIPVPEIVGYDRHSVMPTNLVFRCPIKVGERIYMRVLQARAGLSVRGDHAMFLKFRVMVDTPLARKSPDDPIQYRMAMVLQGQAELRFVESFD